MPSTNLRMGVQAWIAASGNGSHVYVPRVHSGRLNAEIEGAWERLIEILYHDPTMVMYKFPYEEIPPVEIPDAMLKGIYSVKASETEPPPVEVQVRDSIENPIGCEPLCVLARKLAPGKDFIAEKDRRENDPGGFRPSASIEAVAGKVLVIVDDMSRPTPVAAMLPPILDTLREAGISDENISFLVALGTHRPMTRAELEEKLGKDVVRQYVVKNHEWENPAELHEYGVLEDGTRVVLNKAMRDADLVIGVGSIAPHPAAGFSGGGKIIAPGVATEEAVGIFHWESVQVPQGDVLGVRDNPMRDRIDKIARMAGLSFIVNAVMDGESRVVKVVSGDPVVAHGEGCRVATEIFGVEIPHPGDANIYIADTHPLDQDMWQGVKALCALDVVVPDGAVIILVTPASEGISVTHPEILEHGYVGLEKATRLVEEEGLSLIAAHNMVQGGRLLSRTIPFMVSPGIPYEDARRVGFTPFLTPQAALDEAIRIKKGLARIAILRMGGEILPIPA